MRAVSTVLLLGLLAACAGTTPAAVDHESERLQAAYEHCQAEQQQAFQVEIDWPPLAGVDAVHGPRGQWTVEGVFTFDDGGTSRFWCDMSFSDGAGWRVESIGSTRAP